VSIVSADQPGGGFPSGDQRREAALNRLVDMLADGTCTPLLGAGASCEAIPLGERLALTWAKQYSYPLADTTNLARVTQYVLSSGAVHDVEELKDRFVGDFLRTVEPPDFSDPCQIHAVLAGFGLPIYVTTNFDDFMCQALWAQHKKPVVGISPWYPQSSARNASRPVLHDWSPVAELEPLRMARNQPPFQPQDARPLVYHLHGHHSKPASLVLTEDDFIEYLLRLNTDLSKHTNLGETRRDRTVVPSMVQAALGDRSVLFVGYSLRDVSFQVLFRTLTRGVDPRYRHHGISIQLAPPLIRETTCTCDCCDHVGVTADDDKDSVNYAAMDYLDRYFAEQRITVFWGTTRDFAEDLLRRSRERDRGR
jgi:SIR2-like protein